jgi:hypothetical protein
MNEVLHRREHWAKCIGNLYHGRYLPVEVPAINRYNRDIRVGLTEKHQHINLLVLEYGHGIVEPEVLCCVHKLRETWNGKHELLEQSNLQPFEARGRDPTYNRFQVSADASEPEEAKVRMCDVCCDWRMCELPLHITIGNGERKEDRETL